MMTTEKLYSAIQTADAADVKMLLQAEQIKSLLDYCCVRPGAHITITVKHDDGHTATAELYDHALLVQSLCDVLDEFQAELLCLDAIDEPAECICIDD